MINQNTIDAILNDTKLWLLYKHNKSKMEPCLREVGFGEFGKIGFRVRYPTVYWAEWDSYKKFDYSTKKRKQKELEIMSLGDGKMIIYDNWDSKDEYPQEDSFLKNKLEWLEKAEKGKNYFTSKK